MAGCSPALGTWLIVRRLWIYANWPNHPLVRRELERESPWVQRLAEARRLYRYIAWTLLGITLVTTLFEAFTHSQVSFLTVMLMVTLPLLGLAFLSGIIVLAVGWTILLTIAGSALIVRERIARTWDILLTTPVPRTELLLSRLSVGLMRQQSFLTAAILCQFVPLIILVGGLARQYQHGPGGLEVLAMVILTIALFIIDRAQQIALNGLLGLVASLVADSWAMAMVGAVALGAISWLAHAAIAFGLTLVIAGSSALDAAQVFVIGLPSLITAPGAPRLGVLLVAGLLVGQELVVRRLFAWLVQNMGG